MQHDKMDHNSPPQQADMAGASHSMHHEHDAHDIHNAQSAHSGHAEHGMQGGHGEHAGHSEEMFKRPFWISLVLSIPVLLYSDLLQSMLGYTAPEFPGSQYLGVVLGSIIYWYGGWVFLTGAIDELRIALHDCAIVDIGQDRLRR